jgi:DNA-binding protein YbaB
VGFILAPTQGDGWWADVSAFSDDLDSIFRGSDPAQMADRLEEWQRQFDQHLQGFDRLQQAAAGLRVTETAADGGIKVTVDVSGQIVDIVTTDELDSVTSPEVGPLILRCVKKAQQTLAAKFAETAKETLGDDPVRGSLVEQYQQRFPDAEPVKEKKPEPPPPQGDEDELPTKVWTDE